MQPPQGMQAKGTVTVSGSHTHTPAPTARGRRTPTARPVGGQSGEGQRLTSDAPHNGGRHPPRGRPFRHPHSEQRRPAVGPVLGPHARTDRTRDTRVAEPWLPAPEDGQPGGGQRLTPGAPHNGGRPPPPGKAPHHPRGMQPPQGVQAAGTVLGSHTHTPAAHSTWGADPNSPPSGRAVRGGAAPGLRRPPQWWKAPPPRGRPSATPQRATPARKGARCGAGAGSPRPHRPHPGHTGHGTLAARCRGRAAGGGTAPDTRRPSQRWQANPPATAPHHPRGMQPPQGMQAKGTVLGPHTHTPAPTARGWRTPTARPVGGQSGEERRLASDAPHNGGRHPPRGRPSATPTASNAGPQGRTLWGRCWVPTPAPTAPGTLAARSRGRAAGGGRAHDTRRPPQRWRATPPGMATHHPAACSPGRACRPRGQCPHTHTPAPTARGWRTPTARPVGGQSGEERRLTSDAPHDGGRNPPRDAPPPPPQRATPAHKGARCGTGAGSPRPRRSHPGHTGRETLAACSRGRAAGGGRAPDTRRPSQRWQATPSGTAPHHPPRYATPTGHGHAGQGGGAGPPHPHTRAHSTWTWVADLNGPPNGRAVGGGTAPDLGRRWKAPPPGTPLRHPHSEQRRPTRLWGPCWVPTPAPTAPGTHGSRNPGHPLQRTGGRGRNSA